MKMKNDIMIIFPQDETTHFLHAIPDLLFERHGEKRFFYSRLGFSNPEHRNCMQSVETLPNDSFIIFLGHGRHNALLGAFDYERFDFIKQEHMQIFQGKKVFFLSCYSKHLLLDQAIEGIGFDHLLTSTSELGEETHRRKYSYLISADGNDSASVYDFRDRLSQICAEALHDMIVKNLTTQEFFQNLKIRFNKEIVELIMNNDPIQVKNVANLLRTAKNEMQYFSPPTNSG